MSPLPVLLGPCRSPFHQDAHGVGNSRGQTCSLRRERSGAAQEGIDASDHLPESTMGSTSRDRPSATDPRPRTSTGDERPPEDAPVVIPRTAAYAGWIPLRPTIRRDQLRQIVPLADTTIYDMERRGEFPRRFQLTSRCVVWDLREVEAWIESRRQASDLAQIKRAPPPDVRQRRSRPVRSTPAS